MKLLVCVTKTPETTAKIAFTEGNRGFNEQGVQFIMNPYDEWYALVRALELKEQVGGTVTLINVGPESNRTVIQKGLAIGADNAVRINAEPQNAFYVAHQIAAYAKEEAFDMIFLGKESIDYNGAEVGGILAELLDMPFISFATEMAVEGNTATLSRDIEGGTEVLEVDTPFALSAAKGLAEQRIPNMRGIMMAKKKPLEIREPVEVGNLVEVSQYEHPPVKSGVKLIDPEDMEKLVDLLHNEAKVI